MEIAFNVSNLAAGGAAFMLVLMAMQCVSCAYVTRDINDAAGNSTMKIYWSMNVAIQFFGSGFGALGLYAVHLYLK